MKRKVTDLKPNEAILISNDAERDAILQLMEDAGIMWIDCNPTEYKPNFGYPFYLFTYDFDGENRLCTSRNSYDFLTFPATDFIGSEFKGNGLTVSVPDNTISIEPSQTIATLRAEKAELIEALKAIITQWDTPNWKLTESTGTIINQARQTIAKHETK